MRRGNATWWARSVLAGICVLVWAGDLSAQDVRASAAVDTTSVRIGDWIRLHVTVEHPPDVAIRAIAPADSLEGVEILSRD